MRIANFIECMVIELSLCLSICTSMDLIFMIKRPFQDSRVRTKWYFLVSTVVTLLVLGITRGENTGTGYYLYLAQYFTLLVIGTVSCIFAYRSLSVPGMSHYVRNAVLKWQILYLVIFVTTQLYIVAICFFFLSDPNYDP